MTPDTLEDSVVAFIREVGTEMRPDDEKFNELALQIFRYQYQHCSPYRKLCKSYRVNKNAVENWRQIPCVPTDAFRYAAFFTREPSTAARVFMTSGTISGDEKRGRNYLASERIYDIALLTSFRYYCVPDNKALTIIRMVPSMNDSPDSSLGYMCEEVAAQWGTDGNVLAFRNGALDMEALNSALESMESNGEPVLILATAFACVEALDFWNENSIRFKLPRGSRVMETGGYKGRVRSIARDDLYAMLSDALSIPDSHIINEYGMTEMFSQYYDPDFRFALGLATRGESREKVAPPWLRFRVINPATGQDVDEGERGILCHYDLANVHNALALETADVALKTKNGFVLLGRTPGATARGCSLAV